MEAWLDRILFACVLWLLAGGLMRMARAEDMQLACLRDAAQRLQIAAPALAFDPDLRYRAIYVYSTIIARPDADCGVLVHELIHHRQFRDAGGPASDSREWIAREVNARRIELIWRGTQ